MKWLAVRLIRVYCCFRSKGHDAMNQSRSRSKAIAIAKVDESTRKSLLIRAAAIALCALAAIAALPSFWSF